MRLQTRNGYFDRGAKLPSWILLQRFAFAAIARMFTAAAVARASENRLAIVKWRPHGIIEATT